MIWPISLALPISMRSSPPYLPGLLSFGLKIDHIAGFRQPFGKRRQFARSPPSVPESEPPAALERQGSTAPPTSRRQFGCPMKRPASIMHLTPLHRLFSLASMKWPSSTSTLIRSPLSETIERIAPAVRILRTSRYKSYFQNPTADPDPDTAPKPAGSGCTGWTGFSNSCSRDRQARQSFP